MITIPATVRHIVEGASTRDSSARFAITGVQVQHLDDDTVVVSATDTKVLITARFNGTAKLPDDVAAPGLNHPRTDLIADKPNTGRTFLMPFKAWQTAFKGVKPTEAIAMQIGTDEVFTADEHGGMTNTKQVEGRFPPIDQFWPKYWPDDKRAFRVALCGQYLTKLAKALAPVDGESSRMEFTFNLEKPLSPVIVEAKGVDVSAKCILMPMGCREEESEPSEHPLWTEYRLQDKKRKELEEASAIIRAMEHGDRETFHNQVQFDKIEKKLEKANKELHETRCKNLEYLARMEQLEAKLQGVEAAGETPSGVSTETHFQQSDTQLKLVVAGMQQVDEQRAAWNAERDKLKADAEANWIQFAEENAAWAKERADMKRQIAHLESQLSFERSKQQLVTTDNPTPTVRKRVALG